MSLETQITALSSRVAAEFKWRPTLDRPGGYISTGVRRASFSWGGGNEGTFTDKNIAFQRLPIVLPVTTFRWRLRIANKNATGTTTGAGAVTYGPFYIMDSFRNFQTGDPIQWSGTVSQVTELGSSGSQAVGAEWVSPWVTNAGQQIIAGRMRHIGMNWNKAAGSTVYTSSGGGWWSTTMADATATAPTMTYYAQTAFNISLEYEFIGSNKILVAVGDSITEGAGSRFNFLSWHQQLSMRLKMPVCMSGAFGAMAGAQAPANSFGSAALTEPRWQRLRDADCNIDAGIIFLGTNETAWGGTLSQVQDGLLATSNRMLSEWGVRDRYALTIPPQNATAGRETLRTQINNWLRSGTAEFQVFDTQVMMEAGYNSPNLRAGYEGMTGSPAVADYTHVGPAGQLAIANSIQMPS